MLLLAVGGIGFQWINHIPILDRQRKPLVLHVNRLSRVLANWTDRAAGFPKGVEQTEHTPLVVDPWIQKTHLDINLTVEQAKIDKSVKSKLQFHFVLPLVSISCP